MEKKLLIVKNISREGPGLLELELKERGIGFEVVDLSLGERFPDVGSFGAVVILGGPDSANDRTDKILEELKKVKEIVEKGIPYLGICLGMQILVKACGGKVIRCPVKEVGLKAPDGNFFTVELTQEGLNDPLFKGLGRTFKVFQLHGETVELSGGMELLAAGKLCRNQVVRVGRNAYGVQCHFELTPKMLKVWAEEDPDLSKLDRDKLLSNFKAVQPEYERVGRGIFGNFLTVAGFQA